ncbi:Grx4 family monothiol glutaredoxin [Pajaroellobacter abortibovis]|uniref:Glutaredoxin n=1 Tax=Pajaroellobacter abortibovis TaxID=1882918 RepID=A0A1L6MVW3_9BACT|nr:Grx4 family monothiol glutaredoxin [Pajaroellobacter abortibovis]APR99651.1 monothiol glutaredoxin, Grx4 family [Pajaroellobacter abortibovis]
MDDMVQKQIQTLIDSHPVLLFIKGTKTFPQCGFSARVVDILKKEGVPFETVNVLAAPEIREGIKEYSNWPTIPQLYVKGKFLGGCDIVTEMRQNGELSQELKNAGLK